MLKFAAHHKNTEINNPQLYQSCSQLWSTLDYRIIVRGRLLIFGNFSTQEVLIRSRTIIDVWNFSTQEQKIVYENHFFANLISNLQNNLVKFHPGRLFQGGRLLEI